MSEAAEAYGSALYGLARDEGVSQQILEQLSQVSRLFEENPDYVRLLREPSIPKEERCSLLDQGFRGQVHPYCLNFLKILCERGYVARLTECCGVYRRLYQEDNGILEVQAVTAAPMDAALEQRLRQKLEALTGKTIILDCRTDPGVIGGVRLEMAGRELDGTLRRRLDDLQTSLKQTVV